ncbi:cell wall integrity and stress response component 2-like isoform X2 [Portunus trituberculatus]|uniref:cell wall integrity and stress response component 2-like isoform X2 n=1 Tax=Portunus trituberculatus TaxID=210409 RepID=UPI001E1CD01C|nr:cell wall integrity and stress response component 2-like isoform X2 [Portunus trituberculatus]
MDPGAPWKIGKKEQQVWVEEEEGGVSGVEKLRGYYDEARNKLKSYLAMGSGSSSPRPQAGVGVVEGGVGGTVFQQRPAHCRLEGRTDVDSGEEFTDISYSDLGFIITPNPKKLTINNNYKTSVDGTSTSSTTSSSTSSSSSSDPSQASLPTSPTPTPSEAGYMDHQDCDPVSSTVESGNTTHSSTTPSPCSTSSPSTTSHPSLQHRASSSSFTIPGAPSPSCTSPKNLDDLKLEEITS